MMSIRFSEKKPLRVIEVGPGCRYTDVQTAVAAAVAAGATALAPWTLAIQRGTYTETVTLTAGINLVGADPGVSIIGPAGAAAVVAADDCTISNLTLQTTGQTLIDTSAGCARFLVSGCRLLGTKYISDTAGTLSFVEFRNNYVEASNMLEAFDTMEHCVIAGNDVYCLNDLNDMCVALIDMSDSAASHRNVISGNTVYIEKGDMDTDDDHLPYVANIGGWGNLVEGNNVRLVHRATTGAGPMPDAFGLIRFIGPAALTGLTDESAILPNTARNNTVTFEVTGVAAPVTVAAIALYNSSATVAAADLIVANNTFWTDSTNITIRAIDAQQPNFADTKPTIYVMPGGVGGWQTGDVNLSNVLLSLATPRRVLSAYLPAVAVNENRYVLSGLAGAAESGYVVGEWIRAIAMDVSGRTDGTDEVKLLKATLNVDGSATTLVAQTASDGIGGTRMYNRDSTHTQDIDPDSFISVHVAAEADGNSWTDVSFALTYQGLV